MSPKRGCVRARRGRAGRRGWRRRGAALGSWDGPCRASRSRSSPARGRRRDRRPTAAPCGRARRRSPPGCARISAVACSWICQKRRVLEHACVGWRQILGDLAGGPAPGPSRRRARSVRSRARSSHGARRASLTPARSSPPSSRTLAGSSNGAMGPSEASAIVRSGSLAAAAIAYGVPRTASGSRRAARRARRAARRGRRANRRCRGPAPAVLRPEPGRSGATSRMPSSAAIGAAARARPREAGPSRTTTSGPVAAP